MRAMRIEHKASSGTVDITISYVEDDSGTFFDPKVTIDGAITRIYLKEAYDIRRVLHGIHDGLQWICNQRFGFTPMACPKGLWFAKNKSEDPDVLSDEFSVHAFSLGERGKEGHRKAEEFWMSVSIDEVQDTRDLISWALRTIQHLGYDKNSPFPERVVQSLEERKRIFSLFVYRSDADAELAHVASNTMELSAEEAANALRQFKKERNLSPSGDCMREVIRYMDSLVTEEDQWVVCNEPDVSTKVRALSAIEDFRQGRMSAHALRGVLSKLNQEEKERGQ